MDGVVLASPSGKPMHRESDLIDVWFDSGSMPYAQWHYPFENKDKIENNGAYPAHFIAEGVDQTRGWFFTLHAIASMVFDSVAYKTVISNGLVLDKNGQKMSKRLGNAVDPFTTMDQYGADALRWYMLTNASPWDNLRFDMDGLEEVRRKFFGTLHNTYAFFALYANVDGFKFEEAEIPVGERPEMDQWILSELHSLVAEVESGMEAFEPTRAFRPVQEFTTEKLSNWYVRLGRRRFWKGEYGQDKVSAYQTLWTCLETLSRLMAPFAPFYADQLYQDLYAGINKEGLSSVHFTSFPEADVSLIKPELEKKINTARKLTSLVLSIRKKENLKVRQPLSRVLVPALNDSDATLLESIREILLAEVNVKALEVIAPDAGVFVKKVKPNFKALGPKVGRHMKAVKAFVEGMDSAAIDAFEAALVVDPGYNNVYVDLADAARADGLQGKAIHYYREALERDPDNLSAISGEGAALAEKGAMDNARNNLARLEEMCGATCKETVELAAAIEAGPVERVMTAEAVAPDAAVTN